MKNLITPVFEGKGYAGLCQNDRGVSVMPHIKKLHENNRTGNLSLSIQRGAACFSMEQRKKKK